MKTFEEIKQSLSKRQISFIESNGIDKFMLIYQDTYIDPPEKAVPFKVSVNEVYGLFVLNKTKKEFLDQLEAIIPEDGYDIQLCWDQYYSDIEVTIEGKINKEITDLIGHAYQLFSTQIKNERAKQRRLTQSKRAREARYQQFLALKEEFEEHESASIIS